MVGGDRGGVDEMFAQLLATARDELMRVVRSCEEGEETRAVTAAMHVRWILHTIERWAANMAAWDPERHATIATAVADLRRAAEPLLDRAVALAQGDVISRRVGARAKVVSLEALRASDGVIDARGRWLEALELHADLSGALLEGATLHDVTADGVIAARADLRRALLIRSRFGAASLRESILDECAADSCELGRANLERTSWRHATVFGTRFDGACFVDATLDDALFEDCNLRGADLACVHLGERATAVAVKFVRCDLRETNWDGRVLASATFVDCKLHGIHGRPRLAGIVAHRPDLSPQGDGSVIGSKHDVLARWQDHRGTSGGHG